MPLITTELTTHDGERLSVRDFRPEPGRDAKRTLLMVHGIGEHGGRYAHVAQAMNERGWRVITFDLRGHGHSSGTRTHVRCFRDYLDDLVLLKNVCDLDWQRTALFGHSFGGLIVIRAVQRQFADPAAVLLSAPMLKVKVKIPAWKRAFGQIFWRCISRVRFRTNIDAKNLSRDPEFQAQRKADPLIQRHVTAGWFFRADAERKQAWQDAPRWTTPILIAQGTDDLTTDPAAPTEWLNRLATNDKQLLLLPDHVHELLNEGDWKETLSRFADWLERVVVDVSATHR